MGNMLIKHYIPNCGHIHNFNCVNYVWDWGTYWEKVNIHHCECIEKYCCYHGWYYHKPMNKCPQCPEYIEYRKIYADKYYKIIVGNTGDLKFDDIDFTLLQLDTNCNVTIDKATYYEITCHECQKICIVNGEELLYNVPSIHRLNKYRLKRYFNYCYDCYQNKLNHIQSILNPLIDKYNNYKMESYYDYKLENNIDDTTIYKFIKGIIT